MDAYVQLCGLGRGQVAERGRRFNGFLAELLRQGGLQDAVSDQRGAGGRDEIDVSFTFGHTAYILEAKWVRAPIGATALHEIDGRLKIRPSGVRAVLVSMSGFTKPVLERAEFHADVLLLDRSHVEAMASGLISAQALFQRLLAIASRRGGSYVALAELLQEGVPQRPLPSLGSSPQGVEGHPALVEPGVTCSHVLTADGQWTAGEVRGLATDGQSELWWTTADGVLRVDAASAGSTWTPAPAGCQGPALLEASGHMLVLCEEATLRLTEGHASAVGGGHRGASWLMPGPDDTAWVFSTQGPRISGGHGGHTLTGLGSTLADSTSYKVDYAGQAHQAAFTRSGILYVAGGGYDVTTTLEHGLHCPRERWVEPVPLTPVVSLAAGDHTVLLAGPTGRGMEKVLIALDTRTHRFTLLLRLPNTTRITGLAPAGDDAAYLLTDIRGNDHIPRPHLLHVTLPSSACP
jgi:hypothetical protein